MDKEIRGISCDVKNCKHHDKTDCCTAGHIYVGDKSATSISDTACKTFECCDTCQCE